MRLRTKNAEPHLLLHKHTETNPKDANMEGAFLPEGKTHPRSISVWCLCSRIIISQRQAENNRFPSGWIKYCAARSRSSPRAFYFHPEWYSGTDGRGQATLPTSGLKNSGCDRSHSRCLMIRQGAKCSLLLRYAYIITLYFSLVALCFLLT